MKGEREEVKSEKERKRKGEREEVIGEQSGV